MLTRSSERRLQTPPSAPGLLPSRRASSVRIMRMIRHHGHRVHQGHKGDKGHKGKAAPRPVRPFVSFVSFVSSVPSEARCAERSEGAKRGVPSEEDVLSGMRRAERGVSNVVRGPERPVIGGGGAPTAY